MPVPVTLKVMVSAFAVIGMPKWTRSLTACARMRASRTCCGASDSHNKKRVYKLSTGVCLTLRLHLIANSLALMGKAWEVSRLKARQVKHNVMLHLDRSVDMADRCQGG